MKMIITLLDDPKLPNDPKPTEKPIANVRGTYATNLAKKCFERMIKDPANRNKRHEALWHDAYAWADKIVDKNRLVEKDVDKK